MPAQAFGISVAFGFIAWGSSQLNTSGRYCAPRRASMPPTFIVPLLLITHGLVFLILLQRDSVAVAHESSDRPSYALMSLYRGNVSLGCALAVDAIYRNNATCAGRPLVRVFGAEPRPSTTAVVRGDPTMTAEWLA